MVSQPYRVVTHKYVITSSLALSCLWLASFSTTALAATCPAYVFSEATRANQTSHSAAATPRVQLHLQQGLLKPQFEQFLKRHFPVDLVDWQVSAHYQWPSAFTLSADSAEQILEKITQPYQFRITVHANRSAVVSYQFRSQGEL
ncbi:hypothetical protein [Pseudidiomarina woesei]|uniref:Toxin co-regulated pilus biosynthesis protein Q C-terminal domain-containing protein n=1 Tax=Pseudidiomarina woesei TaxID=1381080 RepID=A0A0K6GXX9_9GAMM|nr:hypothetical protein [Pseudidiomarina woesei]CUA83566.1 hypothetical protein Ga0061064_0674 [Pseudidiomarina woesei]